MKYLKIKPYTLGAEKYCDTTVGCVYEIKRRSSTLLPYVIVRGNHRSNVPLSKEALAKNFKALE